MIISGSFCGCLVQQSIYEQIWLVFFWGGAVVQWCSSLLQNVKEYKMWKSSLCTWQLLSSVSVSVIIKGAIVVSWNTVLTMQEVPGSIPYAGMDLEALDHSGELVQPWAFQYIWEFKMMTFCQITVSSRVLYIIHIFWLVVEISYSSHGKCVLCANKWSFNSFYLIRW
jgi:hypothetical protein